MASNVDTGSADASRPAADSIADLLDAALGDAASPQAATPTVPVKPTDVRREFAARMLARKRLLHYIKRFHPGFMANWFHEEVAERLEAFYEAVVNRQSPRLILAVPPRHGKSTMATDFGPSFFLGRHPDHEVIIATHTAALAVDFSKKIRERLRQEEHHVLFPQTQLHRDAQGSEQWRTTRGGGLKAVGVGSAVVGSGAHVLVIDDPFKGFEEALSADQREKVWQWYITEAYTRLAPGGGVLVIAQRWHEDDLTGRLERLSRSGEGDKFEIVRYPAIAVEDEPHRKRGEPLHPERYSKEFLLQYKRIAADWVWEALYQQNPQPMGNAYFTAEMFRFYGPDEAPERDDVEVYIAWDLALGQKERNDYSVAVVVGHDRDGVVWVLDVVRLRADTAELVERMIDLDLYWEPAIHGVEDGHIRQAIGPFLERRIQERKAHRCVITPLPHKRRDKELRARAIQGMMRNGLVRFPIDAPWFPALKNELLAFPGGQHDDQVDALAWIGLMLSEMGAPERVRAPDPERERIERLLQIARRRLRAQHAAKQIDLEP